ncbi:hypothetical protein DFH09DRAFT_1439359 [Mycena vulgaris]|nr:hypothetical protein DFH09DRAFT_1439359 [Mycena vulgaris]
MYATEWMRRADVVLIIVCSRDVSRHRGLILIALSSCTERSCATRAWTTQAQQFGGLYKSEVLNPYTKSTPLSCHSQAETPLSLKIGPFIVAPGTRTHGSRLLWPRSNRRHEHLAFPTLRSFVSAARCKPLGRNPPLVPVCRIEARPRLLTASSPGMRDAQMGAAPGSILSLQVVLVGSPRRPSDPSCDLALPPATVSPRISDLSLAPPNPSRALARAFVAAAHCKPHFGRYSPCRVPNSEDWIRHQHPTSPYNLL